MVWMWARSVMTGAAVTVSARNASWLFAAGNDGCEQFANARGTAVVNMTIEGMQTSKSLLERVFRPTLIEPSEYGKSFGQGWVVDAPEGAPVSLEHLRRMRYVVESDFSGSAGTLVSVAQPDGTFVLASIVATNCGKILMCRLERMSSDGQSMGSCELHGLTKNCSNPKQPLGQDREQTAEGFYSQATTSTWILKEAGRTQTVSIDFSNDPSRITSFMSSLTQEQLSLDDLDMLLENDLELELETLPSIISEELSDGTLSAGSTRKLSHSKPATVFPCEVCGRKFNQSGHRNEHRRRMHEGHGHKCQHCGHLFGVPSKLRRHIRNVHQHQGFTCPLCNLQLDSSSKMEKHIKQHTHYHPTEGSWFEPITD